MKPCNFPERKRERQLGALLRLREVIKTSPDGERRMEKEIKVLEKRTASSRRGIRTKKTRSA